MQLKELYVPPVAKTLELDIESIVCMSGGEFPSWEEEPIKP